MLWLGAIAGAAIATLPGRAGIGCALLGALAGGLIGSRDFRSVRPPKLLLLFFLPVFTLAVAPGEDMAMHVALARGLLDGVLSPAWPGVSVALYPRGFSAVVALLSPMGLARAGLFASGLSYVIFWYGLSEALRKLRVPNARLAALAAVFLSRTPQHFFSWGGNPAAMAIGLALTGRPLLILGAVAVHPMGALAGSLVSLRGFALACVGCAIVALLGPHLSQRELAWLHDYAFHSEGFVKAISSLGDPAVVFTLIALLLRPRWKPLVFAALLALLLLVLPVVNLYPVRFAPLLLLCAVPLWAQLGRVPLMLAILVALPFHWRYFQQSKPLASFEDVRAFAKIPRVGPPIDVPYDSAGQWIPALTGRAITHPHEHVTLFDEIEAGRTRATP
jgi:hypothetical protein